MPHRAVYFGSPEFAVPTLRAVHVDPRFELKLVVTQPDRKAGRGRRIVESVVKSTARELGVNIWQPETLRSAEAVQRLAVTNPDLFVVVAYGEIFRRSVLSIPRHGCLNVHPSLLPKYRGSSPIQAAILNGDEMTGVSIIEMVRKLDAGPIVAQREFALTHSETGGDLSQQLAQLAGQMMPDVADDWCAGRIRGVPQDDEFATFTREITKADGRIDWALPAQRIERMVRAYSPWPTAWTTIYDRRLVIHSSEVWPKMLGAQPGSVFEDNGRVLVACGSDSLNLIQVQPEGKRAMSAQAWWRGLRTDETARFDPA